MQSNTVKVENQPINFSNFSVEKKAYRSDPFTIRDGRYVGNDGFVVPRDFEEFCERFPDYVRKWVSKHADKSASKQDVEDWTQDLLIHMQHLPPTSKYRKAGKKDIVQTFDPARHHGANEARFRNYINLCLANKFRTMHSKRTKDALFCPGNFSLDGQKGGDDLYEPDELCYKHSAYFRAIDKASQKQSHDRAFLQEFLNFVGRNDVKALPTIEAVMATGTRSDAANWLGITELEFDRMHTRVRHLARCFESGEVIPKQRRPYRRRSDFSGCELVA